MPEAEYVTQEVFDMQVKSLRERGDLIDRLSDARSDRIEALMGQTLAEIRMNSTQLKTELKNEINEMKGELKVMNARIDKNLAEYKAIAEGINGEVKALKTGFDTLQNKFSWNIAWMGIIIGVVLAVIQHFWK